LAVFSLSRPCSMSLSLSLPLLQICSGSLTLVPIWRARLVSEGLAETGKACSAHVKNGEADSEDYCTVFCGCGAVRRRRLGRGGGGTWWRWRRRRRRERWWAVVTSLWRRACSKYSKLRGGQARAEAAEQSKADQTRCCRTEQTRGYRAEQSRAAQSREAQALTTRAPGNIKPQRRALALAHWLWHWPMQDDNASHPDGPGCP
jgi:hypothetical protein